jgi:Holliday junction resolvasome RuvABC DNA-binding subunit
MGKEHQKNIEALKNMGFSEEQARNALSVNDNKLLTSVPR